MAKREREQRGDLDSVKGECEVKDIWQGCITGVMEKKWKQWRPGKEEEEQVPAWCKEL